MERLNVWLEICIKIINYLISIDYRALFYRSTFISYMYLTFWIIRVLIGAGLTLINAFNWRNQFKGVVNTRPYLMFSWKQAVSKGYINFFFKNWF